MIKAIETKYKGYRFHSRLEARWAVFFDALGLDWEYEPEGFDLGEAGWYLPDFKITGSKSDALWCEVKPEKITTDEKFEKFESLLQESDWGTPVVTTVLLTGDPFSFLIENTNRDTSGWVCEGCGLILNKKCVEDRSPFLDGLATWYCYSCDSKHSTGDHFYSVFDNVVQIEHHKGFNHYVTPATPKIRNAAIKARSARFEHGEEG